MKVAPESWCSCFYAVDDLSFRIGFDLGLVCLNKDLKGLMFDKRAQL